MVMSHFVGVLYFVSLTISPVGDEDVTILVQAVPFSIIVLKELSLIEISERTN